MSFQNLKNFYFKVRQPVFILKIFLIFFTLCFGNLFAIFHLPNVTEEEEGKVYAFELQDEKALDLLDRLFSNENIKNYLTANKANLPLLPFDRYQNPSLIFSEDEGFTILSSGSRAKPTIILEHSSLPDYVIKIQDPSFEVFEPILIDRISARNELETIMQKKEYKYLHLPEKYSYIFPFVGISKMHSKGPKPYAVIAKKVKASRTIKDLRYEEAFEALSFFNLKIYFDIKKENFLINEEGLWIVDTEYYTVEYLIRQFKKSFHLNFINRLSLFMQALDGSVSAEIQRASKEKASST